MRLFSYVCAVSVAFAASFASAGDPPCPGGRCEVKTRPECFNLVCYYQAKGHDSKVKNCKVAATFVKNVTLDGGEVQDDSGYENNPAMSVACDDKPAFFDNGAHRYTNLLGTRIQGQMGPRPAIYLPRGALHSGSNGQSGPHVSTSLLDIETGDLNGETERLRGKCEIWTGAP